MLRDEARELLEAYEKWKRDPTQPFCLDCISVFLATLPDPEPTVTMRGRFIRLSDGKWYCSVLDETLEDVLAEGDYTLLDLRIPLRLLEPPVVPVCAPEVTEVKP